MNEYLDFIRFNEINPQVYVNTTMRSVDWFMSDNKSIY